MDNISITLAWQGLALPSGGTHAHPQQIVFVNCLALYHKSPDFGQRQYKSRI